MCGSSCTLLLERQRAPVGAKECEVAAHLADDVKLVVGGYIWYRYDLHAKHTKWRSLTS
jgi:hypothetical protein